MSLNTSLGLFCPKTNNVTFLTKIMGYPLSKNSNFLIMQNFDIFYSLFYSLSLTFFSQSISPKMKQ